MHGTMMHHAWQKACIGPQKVPVRAVPSMRAGPGCMKLGPECYCTGRNVHKNPPLLHARSLAPLRPLSPEVPTRGFAGTFPGTWTWSSRHRNPLPAPQAASQVVFGLHRAPWGLEGRCINSTDGMRWGRSKHAWAVVMDHIHVLRVLSTPFMQEWFGAGTRGFGGDSWRTAPAVFYAGARRSVAVHTFRTKSGMCGSAANMSRPAVGRTGHHHIVLWQEEACVGAFAEA